MKFSQTRLNHGYANRILTIDLGSGRDAYQGIVALAKEPLVTAADTYFRQSEQLPTFLRLAVARHYGPAEAGGGARTWHWRAGGLMIQQLAREGGKRDLEGEAHDASLEGDEDEIEHLEGRVFLQNPTPLKRQRLKRQIERRIKAGDWVATVERPQAP